MKLENSVPVEEVSIEVHHFEETNVGKLEGRSYKSLAKCALLTIGAITVCFLTVLPFIGIGLLVTGIVIKKVVPYLPLGITVIAIYLCVAGLAVSLSNGGSDSDSSVEMSSIELEPQLVKMDMPDPATIDNEV